MAELKTQKSDNSVEEFIAGIDDEQKQEDSRALLDLMSRVTGETPHMWGASIIGFGDHHYEYASGREADWFKVGFSPRKQNLTLYVMAYVHEDDPLLSDLGRHSTGKSCIYIKRLSDVDTAVLEKLVKRSYDALS
ncbi:MAG TPA: DUF1801 domain-containing protein [Acidimicrobiia bacterium]|jgi:hypothetical protein